MAQGWNTLLFMVLAIILAGCNPSPKNVVDVDAAAVQLLLQEHGSELVVVDVRTRGEYEAGHLPGAINIDMGSPDFEKKLEAQSSASNKPWLIYCRSGNRSNLVLHQIRRFAPEGPLYHMNHGLQTWQGALERGRFSSL